MGEFPKDLLRKAIVRGVGDLAPEPVSFFDLPMRIEPDVPPDELFLITRRQAFRVMNVTAVTHISSGPPTREYSAEELQQMEALVQLHLKAAHERLTADLLGAPITPERARELVRERLSDRERAALAKDVTEP
jgi:hypothetical protein